LPPVVSDEEGSGPSEVSAAVRVPLPLPVSLLLPSSGADKSVGPILKDRLRIRDRGSFVDADADGDISLYQSMKSESGLVILDRKIGP
jgi:hypothetical protein